MARSKVLDITDQSIPKRYVEFKAQTLSGNNTTVATPLFSVTGAVKVTALYSVVTTLLGSNVTAAHYRVNDATAQTAITLATGSTLSNYTVGSIFARTATAATALQVKISSQGNVLDAFAATVPDFFMPFVVIQKVGDVDTNIEFVYTTTNTPTSGVIKHYVEFEPLTPDSDLVAV